LQPIDLGTLSNLRSLTFVLDAGRTVKFLSPFCDRWSPIIGILGNAAVVKNLEEFTLILHHHGRGPFHRDNGFAHMDPNCKLGRDVRRKDLDFVFGDYEASPIYPAQLRAVTITFEAQARHVPDLPTYTYNEEFEAFIRNELRGLQAAGILAVNWTHRSYDDQGRRDATTM
jgi:hypothetical protein